MRAILLIWLLGTASWGEGAFGSWKMNAVRSTFPTAPRPRSVTLRIEPHAKGEVFTLDEIDPDGRASSDSTILYLDGKPRDFGDPGCSGAQSSRRTDSRTVEILRTCQTGEWIKFVRRLATSSELVLEITARQPGGRQVERRLVLEKQ